MEYWYTPAHGTHRCGLQIAVCVEVNDMQGAMQIGTSTQHFVILVQSQRLLLCEFCELCQHLHGLWQQALAGAMYGQE